MTVTLIVKGETSLALEEVERRIGGAVVDWFVEDSQSAPFPPGALLWYRIAEYEPSDEERRMDESHHSCSDCQDLPEYQTEGEIAQDLNP